MDIYTFFKVLRRNWWLIVLSLMATLGSTAFFVTRQAPVYQSTTTLEMRPSASLQDVRDVMEAWETIGERTMLNTVARKATSTHTLESVAAKLNVPSLVEADVSAVVLPETFLIEIRSSSTDPELAASLANGIAEELSTGMQQEVVRLAILDRAVPAQIPSEPRPVRALTLGAIAGLGVGFVFAFLEYSLQMALAGSRRVRSGREDDEDTDSQVARARRAHETTM